MKLVYVAMPYSHPNPDVIAERMEVFYKIAADLLLQGKMVISPVLNHSICKRYNVPSDYKFWGDYSRTLLSKCDEIVVLEMDGWTRSAGVIDEIATAKDLHIPIIFMKVK